MSRDATACLQGASRVTSGNAEIDSAAPRGTQLGASPWNHVRNADDTIEDHQEEDRRVDRWTEASPHILSFERMSCLIRRLALLQ